MIKVLERYECQNIMEYHKVTIFLRNNKIEFITDYNWIKNEDHSQFWFLIDLTLLTDNQINALNDFYLLNK